jgi:hypothetical protein
LVAIVLLQRSFFIEHRKAFDAAVRQQHRSLFTKEECETTYEEILGVEGCTCIEEEEEFGGTPTDECYDEIINLCTFCDTLEGERTCLVEDSDASEAAESSDDDEAECYTYTSGLFANTICAIDNTADDTCTITIDGTECNSCEVVTCDVSGYIYPYNFDCSNVIDGETWNVCNDDIPETSPFIYFDEDTFLFDDVECVGIAISSSSPIAGATASVKEQCETQYEEDLGVEGCTCTEDGEPTDECYDEIINLCTFCDTLEGERTCLVEDSDASEAAESTDEVEAECVTYTSGLFAITICAIDNTADDTCTITIDGTECSSCELISCSDSDGYPYDLDCSNVIAGETWNVCTDDIPETSPFLAFGNNDRFLFDDVECDTIASPPSGAFALSFHALSMVGLIVVATFW